MPESVDPTIPTPPKPVPQQPTGPIVHTYESDLALAMDTTDASVVQELLQTARERENADKEKEVVRRQKGWYTTGGIILFVLALSASIYGYYYYKNLTVDVAAVPSVGVFQSTAALVTSDSDLANSITKLTTEDTIIEGKPLLVPLYADATTLIPLSPEQTLAYLNINLGEPFLATVSLVRLGVYNNGNTVSPFLIFSVPNPETATKEFLLAEPKLLELTAPIFNINLTNTANQVGTTFESTYMYNLPVRTLTATNLDTNIKTILMYYGYATDTTIVIATNPTILKSVYDTIIRQR